MAVVEGVLVIAAPPYLLSTANAAAYAGWHLARGHYKRETTVLQLRMHECIIPGEWITYVKSE